MTAGWGLKVHDPDCPRANLPDVVVSPRCPPPSLTVENVRHHDQLMEDNHSDGGNEGKVAKTGILKGGKLWKNGGDSRKLQRVEVEKTERTDEPRRSVRFSGRDEYTTLEEAEFDKLPFDVTNEEALARFLSPKFRELGDLLGEQEQEDWLLELSPIASNTGAGDLDLLNRAGEIQHLPTCAKHGHNKPMDEPQMDDEHISESVQRYEEMRRRIAVAEGRDTNSVCSDESKSSSDSQSSDSTATETRIRRLENTDMAHVAGGVMRSNSEVRRAIERNALRRSLIRFAEARKKDTNKNDKNEKHETSLIEKLKWLTTSEDATNGNADEKMSSQSDSQDVQQSGIEEDQEEKKSKEEEAKINCTIEQYRKLAEMFNKTTSLRANDITVPGDVREWKLEADLFPCEKIITDLENDDLPPGTLTFTAVPAVSVCEQISDDESEKLIYSGGIRYTKEGTLPMEMQRRQQQLQQQQQNQHQLQQQQQQQQSTTRERSSHGSNLETYTVDDIDEVLHDDRSSSVPSSSQSSPRLSGRSDVDGTSTAESGYSSNETNSELGPLLPPELDELAEFVKQDAGRIERIRKRYDETEDHGFCRRPSVRGIKPRFGSTTDLLKQMANQLVPPNVTQPSLTGTHLTWPYRDGNEEDGERSLPQRRRITTISRNNPLPALQEDIPYGTSSETSISSSENNALRTVHTYSSTGDLRVPSSGRLVVDPNDIIRPAGHLPPQRTQSYSSLPQINQFIPTQMTGQCQGMAGNSDHHHPSCASRRPASVHGHAPTDMLVSGPQHPTPSNLRSFYTLPHQSHQRIQCQSHEDPGHSLHESSHIPLGPRGSYPDSGSNSQYVPPNVVHDHHNNVPITYQHSPQVNSEEIQAPIGHQSSNTYSGQRLPSGHSYDRNYCPGWHTSNSNPNFVHSSHAIPPPIVSSQMSYTTPIVPEASNPRPSGGNVVNGMLMKMEIERGVPEGASSSPRVIVDSQYPPPHHASTRETGLLHHHPQAMNVST